VDVQETMNKSSRPRTRKIAAIDFATAVETQADGQRRAEIKKAEGVKQATILTARARRRPYSSSTGGRQVLCRQRADPA